MKFAIPEISWHNRDPVLSVDFQPKAEPNDPLRLASGGTDSHVLIWYLSTTETGSVHLEVAADLTRHQKAVNVVRWSPNGQLLASGDDESIIFIWKQKLEELSPATEGEEQYKETWVVYKTLRGHMEDVLDISWSMDGSQLASGSVDNKLIVWDIHRARYTTILSDHKGFVQGVCWDPKGQYITSTSTDRVFRAFDVSTKKVVSRSSKASLPFPTEHPLHGSRQRLYHDDTLQTYYRRLQFSPDGLYIAVPAGRVEPEGKPDVKPINAVYIYTRYCLKTPVCVVPCGEPALVTRWSPIGFRPRAAGPAPRLPSPSGARHVLAVGTRRSVLVYDTQQKTPIAIVANVHYTRLTDLTWSNNGRILVASSTDGFCSIITFNNEELGEPLPLEPNTENKPEPMETQDEKPATQTEAPKPTKIDSFIKFKAPEKSPKNLKTQTEIKTPVKIDFLEEVANPSWSDNSNNEIIKHRASEPMDSDVTVIEDSGDIKLVYEETEGVKSPPKTQQANKLETKSKQNTSPKDNQFFRQAKVTDVKQPIAATVSSPKAPRRVSFVTLSSPKNAKKK